MAQFIAIFDLDGTLLDTLDDLAGAVNRTLVSMGFPARTRDEVRAFVGNGVGKESGMTLPSKRKTWQSTPVFCLENPTDRGAS